MKHTYKECPPGECESPGTCVYCDGGLRACTVCGGAESSLPKDCPGTRMDADRMDLVSRRMMDYDALKGWFAITGDRSKLI